MRTLVLGGARSGKSAVAEQLVAGRPDVTYVATARPFPGDEDFAERIARHRERRPATWCTEDQRDLIEVLQTATAEPTSPAILADDLGTWITVAIDAAKAWDQPRGTIGPRCSELVAAVERFPATGDLVLVSPEVGMSVVPEHRAGRLFRDELGALNAAIADACDRVMLVVAGQQLRLK